MHHKESEQDWIAYKEQTLNNVSPTLRKLGFALDISQPHTIGERFLMQAITTTSGKKLILLGKRLSDDLRVVIKVTNDKYGKEELQTERKSREILGKINFASRTFNSPREILFEEHNEYLISIHEFIEQNTTFLARPLEEQFYLALSAFKAQEGAHASTYGHIKTIKRAFSIFNADDYIGTFKTFLDSTKDTEIRHLLEEAFDELKGKKETIEQYCGFLVHTDFVPHNIRIHRNKLYLLDHSSIRFGNKYEGWARFLNFMTLYNRELEALLLKYISDNRTPEELSSLKLMRIYRLGEIISYYTKTLSKSEGELRELNEARIYFWKDVLKAILKNQTVSDGIHDSYIAIRDRLRSDEEKERQKNLH